MSSTLRAAVPPEGLLLTDLLQDLEDVVTLMVEQITTSSWLDAYLLCAAADQILEDGLGGRASIGRRQWWRRVVRELDRTNAPSPATYVVRSGVALADRASELARASRRAHDAHDLMSSLACSLAEVVLDPDAVTRAFGERCLEAAVKADATVRALPRAMRLRTLRLPSSFRSFDQHPADVEALVSRLAERWPDRSIPLTVVGVRTSGSYLAPLAAAAARKAGYTRVCAMTVRPGATPGPAERRRLQRAASDDDLVLLLDDPPVSGRSLRDAADGLARLGVRRDRIVMLVAVHDDSGALPDLLRGFHHVTLPWRAWHVHEALDPERVRGALERMLPAGVQVNKVSRWCRGTKAIRGHVQAFYTAEVSSRGDNARRRLDLAVEGAGLGLFGRHSLAVARALDTCVPAVLGFDDGLVYRRWLPGPPSRLSTSDVAVVSAVADYASRRHAALPVDKDRSRDLAGDQPVWEVASMILSSPLGRAALPLRPFVVEPLARRLLAVDQPSVIDGRMGGRTWFRPHGADVVKYDFASAAFSNLDLACYDPIFDLAGAAVEMEDGRNGAARSAALRGYFEERSGLRIDDERWLLYELVHLWNARRTGHLTVAGAMAASSRAVHRYLARVYLADIPVPAEGPLCAIDLDGVLEGGSLGFSATTASGALALRTLRAHGYRVLIATGRSVPEVVERCEIFDLAGGVAEYGSAVYDSTTGVVTELLSDGEIAAVARARAWLERRARLEVDPRYQRVARVRRTGTKGSTSVSADDLSGLPEPDDRRWQFVVGEDQTDIVTPDIDKGLGLRMLAVRLEPDGESPAVDLAVGDTEADLPMLRLARLPFAPANASDAVQKSGVPVLRSGYQRGLAEAVGFLVGHAPGSCRTCAPPVMPAERRLLLRALSVQEAGGPGMLRRIGELTSAMAVRTLLR